MPTNWDAAQHERLLFSIIATHKISWQSVSADLKNKHGPDQPTVRAIDQHIIKLKKSHGLGSGDGTPKKGTPMKNAYATPSKQTKSTPKTPTSNKRKAVSMSDEDDTEPEVNGNFSARKFIPRRSKTPARYDHFDSTSDGDVEGEVPVKEEGVEGHRAAAGPKFAYADSETEGTDGEFAMG